MKTLFSAVMIAALISGCSSLTDSARGPYAGSSSSTATDAGVQASNGNVFPQDTDQGKF